MAIARLSMKLGHRGKGGPHADYITRQGEYAPQHERFERLEAVMDGNMPTWAVGDARSFFEASDANERANAKSYREMELSLPRELTPEQRVVLMDEWCQQELPRYPFLYAIHNPKAMDGGEQPHAHLMFSERENDGIERDEELFFRRANRKHPERGGARKTYNLEASKEERQNRLVALRQRWQAHVNEHLARADIAARIDMRSYADQGIDRQPQPKMTPRQSAEKKRLMAEADTWQATAETMLADAQAQAAEYIRDRERQSRQQLVGVLRQVADQKQAAERARTRAIEVGPPTPTPMPTPISTPTPTPIPADFVPLPAVAVSDESQRRDDRNERDGNAEIIELIEQLTETANGLRRGTHRLLRAARTTAKNAERARIGQPSAPTGNPEVGQAQRRNFPRSDAAMREFIRAAKTFWRESSRVTTAYEAWMAREAERERQDRERRLDVPDPDLHVPEALQAVGTDMLHDGEPQEPEPQPEPAFDARAKALEIIKMPTEDERAGVFRSAMKSLDLDDFDALDVELEPLMFGPSGKLTAEGQQLRNELMPPDNVSSQRAERLQGEQTTKTRGWTPGNDSGPSF